MNYFDLFKENTIDLTEYNKTNGIKFDYYQSQVLNMKELSSMKNWKNVIDNAWIIDYIVPQDSRLDKLSYNLYGNTEFWWIFLMLNDINNPFDWILNDKEILELANTLYTEYNIYSLRCYQNMLFEYYNNRRNIKIISPSYLTNFLKALKDKSNE